MDLSTLYQDRAAHLDRQIRRLRGRARGFVSGEIVSFLAAVACVTAITVTDLPVLKMVETFGAAVCAVVYVVIRRRDGMNDERIRRLEDLRQVYLNELSAQRGDFGCFDDGQRYVDIHHAYSYDLDLFGRDGLYQRMERMATTGGCDALAERLCSADGRMSTTGIPHGCDEQDRACRERIETLARDEEFRSAFISYGVRQKIDTEAIRRALRAAGEVGVSRRLGSAWVLALAWADLAAFYIVLVLAGMGKVSGMLPLWWGILQFFGIYLLCTGPLRRIGAAIDRLHGQLKQFFNVVKLMDAGRAEVFKRLTALLDGIDKRGNVMGLMMVDTFALYDLFLVRKFLRWVEHGRLEMEQWIDRVVKMDQDVTVATWLYNHPETCWPRWSDAQGVDVEARGLYHPFLGERAVRNDFHIDDRHFYIITGANMAGKSTFLRSVGVNYVLARIGFPVCAETFRVSRFKLFSSMRTSDDLAHGISYFNAELRRLGELIESLTPLVPAPETRETDHAAGKGLDMGQEQPEMREMELNSKENEDIKPLTRHSTPSLSRGEGGGDEASLLILDEILKGTNSLDKLNGSRLFLDTVARMNVTGIVATHDLELSKMEDERFHNYCFEIELGTDVTYSYKITAGVARNQNATFLLKQLLNGLQDKSNRMSKGSGMTCKIV